MAYSRSHDLTKNVIILMTKFKMYRTSEILLGELKILHTRYKQQALVNEQTGNPADIFYAIIAFLFPCST